VIHPQDVFLFDYGMGSTITGASAATQATGVRPKFADSSPTSSSVSARRCSSPIRSPERQWDLDERGAWRRGIRRSFLAGAALALSSLPVFPAFSDLGLSLSPPAPISARTRSQH